MWKILPTRYRNATSYASLKTVRVEFIIKILKEVKLGVVILPKQV